MSILRSLVVVSGVCALVGCRTTKPGTDVQVVDEGGSKTYVGGAAGPGINHDIACDTAVNRSVAAIALRFSQDNDDLKDGIAKDLGVDDGGVFLEKYARATMQGASVQSVNFNPAQHLCMATVRWKPPVFVGDAVKSYAEKLKTEEHAAANPTPAPSAPAETQPSAQPVEQAPVVSQPSKATETSPSAVAPATPQPVATPKCVKERDRQKKTGDALQKATDDMNECLRRTSNNEKTCSRYQLYVNEAKAKDDSATATLNRCTGS